MKKMAIATVCGAVLVLGVASNNVHAFLHGDAKQCFYKTENRKLNSREYFWNYGNSCSAMIKVVFYENGRRNTSSCGANNNKCFKVKKYGGGKFRYCVQYNFAKDRKSTGDGSCR